MGYKLTETEVLAQPSDFVDESLIKSLTEYETTDGRGDGGYLDTFNSLKQQVDFNYFQYKEQLRSLVKRETDIKEDLRYSLKMLIIVIVVPIIYIFLIWLFKSLGLMSDTFAALYIIFFSLNFAVIFICYGVIFPGVFKNFLNRYGQYKILHSDRFLKNYRESNRIISFQDEKNFLKKTITEFDIFYEEVLTQGLDKRDGALGGNDSGVLTRDQTMVLDKMRKLSVFRDYTASVSTTRKDVGIVFVVIFILVAAIIMDVIVMKSMQ
ncbi:MAG: hypothetical protein K6E10_06425 [Eubacterium sp.]|nr:hypothetical protein [Eubacterium sp.]